MMQSDTDWLRIFLSLTNDKEGLVFGIKLLQFLNFSMSPEFKNQILVCVCLCVFVCVFVCICISVVNIA